MNDQTRTLYLDMDGVVADFDTAAEQFLCIARREDYVQGHYKLSKPEWARLRDQHRFYRDLPKMAQADQLVAVARQYRDSLDWQLKFLTAVPKNDDMPWAFSDKVLWAQEHYPDIPVMFGPHSTDKYRHCRPGDILIDDRLDNCEAWLAAGGWSFQVKHRDLTEAIAALEHDLISRDRNRLLLTVLD